MSWGISIGSGGGAKIENIKALLILTLIRVKAINGEVNIGFINHPESNRDHLSLLTGVAIVL